MTSTKEKSTETITSGMNIQKFLRRLYLIFQIPM